MKHHTETINRTDSLKWTNRWRIALSIHLTVICLFMGCVNQNLPDVIVRPTESAEPVIESQVPNRPLPDGPAKSYGFGLAWTPVQELDPYKETGRYNRVWLPLLYEGLFELDASFAPQYRLCKSMTCEGDGLTVRLTLSTAAVFSNGQALTAADVVYSFERARAQGSVYADRLKNIVSAAEVEETVVLTLAAPQARLAAVLDFPIVAKDSGESPAGTGYYVLTEDENGIMALVPNEVRDGYDRLSPYRIDLKDVSDPSNLNFYFQYGHISILAYDYNDPLSAGFHSGFDRYDYPGTDFQFIVFNRVHPLLQDAAVRRALAYAVDRDTLCSMLGAVSPAVLPVPPASRLYTLPESAPQFDPAEVLSRLDELGAEDNDNDGVLELTFNKTVYPLEFTLLVCADNWVRITAAKKLAADLLEIGIVITVREASWKNYKTAIQTGAYDLCWGQAQLSPDFDPALFLSENGALRFPLVTPLDDGDFETYRDAAPGAAEALEALHRANNPYAEMSARQKIYQIWLEESEYIAIGFGNKSLLTQRGLCKTPTPSNGGVFYGFTDWGLSEER